MTISDWSKVKRPIPVPNDLTKPYWEAAKKEVLAMQHCQECGTYQHPPEPICMNCGSPNIKFDPVEGKGTIYAVSIMFHAGDQRFVSVVPYASILVELDQAMGPKIAGNLLGAPYTEAKIGRRVEVVFEKINDDITLPQFRLAK